MTVIISTECLQGDWDEHRHAECGGGWQQCGCECHFADNPNMREEDEDDYEYVEA